MCYTRIVDMQVGKSEVFKDNLRSGCTRNSVVGVPSGKSDVLVILLFLLCLSLLFDRDWAIILICESKGKKKWLRKLAYLGFASILSVLHMGRERNSVFATLHGGGGVNWLRHWERKRNSLCGARLGCIAHIEGCALMVGDYGYINYIM